MLFADKTKVTRPLKTRPIYLHTSHLHHADGRDHPQPHSPPRERLMSDLMVDVKNYVMYVSYLCDGK